MTLDPYLQYIIPWLPHTPVGYVVAGVIFLALVFLVKIFLKSIKWLFVLAVVGLVFFLVYRYLTTLFETSQPRTQDVIDEITETTESGGQVPLLPSP